MGAKEALLVSWLGGSAIAGLTWFFSFRPRLYLRLFIPREDWQAAVVAVLRDPGWPRGMRRMAAVQLGFAGCFGLAALWLYLA